MSSKKTIAIVDYGVGNLGSLIKAFKQSAAGLDVDVILTEESTIIQQAHGLVLPGQGAFKTGMGGLHKRGLVDIIQQKAREDVPMLGICLGPQLFFTESEEFGLTGGLNILPGRVVHFPPLAEHEKVPHMGWNAITPAVEGQWQNSIFETIPPGASMYFVHSYIMVPGNKEHIFATTQYGGHTFCSVVRKGNIYGCQFHPEKSGPTGLRIIKSYIDSLM
ncbi:MAG TPA: imidazole glycerol phosphate synthase subunit HisH [Candidatus Magasanikbacteria bacterium]|nr:imidazole glycerol phosphate synthase subunit HisH [Candidatus Magasanikbacteria bacterium]